MLPSRDGVRVHAEAVLQLICTLLRQNRAQPLYIVLQQNSETEMTNQQGHTEWPMSALLPRRSRPSSHILCHTVQYTSNSRYRDTSGGNPIAHRGTLAKVSQHRGRHTVPGTTPIQEPNSWGLSLSVVMRTLGLIVCLAGSCRA